MNALKRLLAAAAVVLAVLVPAATQAASDSITPNGPAALDQPISFTITLADKKYDCDHYNGRCARVNVFCYQSGELVSGHGMDLDTARDGFLLGVYSVWFNDLGGPADCVADLFRWSYQGGSQQYVFLATVSFSASG